MYIIDGLGLKNNGRGILRGVGWLECSISAIERTRAWKQYHNKLRTNLRFILLVKAKKSTYRKKERSPNTSSNGAAVDKASDFSCDLGGGDDKKYVAYKTTPTFKTAVASPRCKAVLQTAEETELKKKKKKKKWDDA